MSRLYAEVALPLPIRQTFTYRLGDDLVEETVVGSAVVVPFGRRTVTGYVVGLLEEPGEEVPERLKGVQDVLDPGPLFPAELLAVTRWMSDYYLCGWGEVLRAAVPEGAQIRSKLRARITPAGASEDAAAGLSESGRKLLGLLRDRQEGDATDLGRSARVSSPHAVLRRLEERGLVEVFEEVRKSGYSRELEEVPLPGELDAEGDEPPDHDLTPSQREALAPLREALSEGRFLTALLHGVTSSGKTAVYEALVADALEQGKGAIVMVPEIAITPQMVRLFRARFGERVALFHSRLKARDRHAQWRRVLRGEAPVVIGPRSAVLAPVPELGVLVVDEEHEPSYKQSEPAPRYHGRDVAIYRAWEVGAVCVLGSATPSAESYRNAREGKYLLLEMPERIDDRPLPRIELVDLAAEPKPWEDEGGEVGREEEEEEGPSREVGAGIVFSRKLEEALRSRLEQGEQAILFLNRRGFSPFLTCADCGHVEECSNCSVSMVFHAQQEHLRCHYCGSVRRSPRACPECGSDRLYYQGLGTQRVEALTRERFPGIRVLRMDSDSTRKRGSHARLYRSFARGEGEVLLGTQMVAKGFHFPDVTLVGVISADAELHFPDFRANERTFQLLTQVAGRAGRGERLGEVVVQTYAPENPGVLHAAAGDFRAFMEAELASREALGYPPFGRMVRVLVRGREEEAVAEEAAAAAKALGMVAPDSVLVLGPAPAPLYRVNRQYRVHLFLRGPSGATLRKCVEASRLLERGRPGLAVTVDVDPVDVL
ncbi:MAG: primosomal protein N' [bacterium]